MQTIGAVVAIAAAAVAAAPAAGAGRAVRATAATTCPDLPQGRERVTLDPADFTTTIDNPWFPLRPGARWFYRETSPDGDAQRVTVTVTDRTRTMANGVVGRAVRDTVTEKGVPVEDTFDWYAQDRAGNVWYLGEQTSEYENGRVVSTEGSFEAGVDGAQAGIAMPGRPRVGCRYRQEDYAGHAEDRGEVFSLREQVSVPIGHYADVVMIREANPLEPRVLEYKFYARGVGQVLAVDISGGAGREELLRRTRGR